jgi:uncharacterized delta-60 repeat protein
MRTQHHHGRSVRSTPAAPALRSLRALFVSAALLISGLSLGQPAAPDPTFLIGTGFQPVNSINLLDDGRTLWAGDMFLGSPPVAARLVRLNTDGTTDPAFNIGTGPSATVWGSVIRADGKILIGGDFTAYNGTSVPRLALVNADGSLNTTFNSGGAGANGLVYRVLLQPDGKILICGAFTTYNGVARSGLARLNADGSLDTSFSIGTGFININPTSMLLRGLALQSDGKVLVGGVFTGFNGTTTSHFTRLNADGSLDASFNTGTGFDNPIQDIKLQPDGKILAVGPFVTSYNGLAAPVKLVRLLADGTRDATFAPNYTTTAYGQQSIAIQADGKILVSGSSYSSSDGTEFRSLIRVNTNGTLDECFRNPVGNGNVSPIEVLPDQKILIGGTFSNYWDNTQTRAGVLRLNGGDGGYVTPDAPTALTGTPGNYSLQIAFTPGANGGASLSNYQYTLDDGTTWTSFSPAVITSPVSITGLINGNTYTVQLRAVNCQGPSPASAPVTVTLPPPTVPDAPTNLTATAGIGTAGITFTPGSDGGSPITNHEYSLDGGLTWIALNPADNSSPISISGLDNCTAYAIQIRAVNGVGGSAASAAVDVETARGVNSGINWAIQSPATNNGWYSVAYGNGLFVAVSYNGTGNRVMTSPDGITWTTRNSAADNDWYSVTFGNGLFVAVAGSGTGNRVMTSPDGITWTIRTSAANNTWQSVTYGSGLFVAVANSGTGNRVMTSPDGITWTIRTTPVNNSWQSVTFGNGLFVAVAVSGTGNRVMTSPDGITWTIRTSAADNQWYSLTFGNGLFVAVAASGSGNRVMTSPDGITWTIRTSAANNSWYSVKFGDGLFVAVAGSGAGNRVMTSPDGITWTIRSSAADNSWYSVSFGNGRFVAVAYSGNVNLVMTSIGSLSPDQPVIDGITGAATALDVAFTAPSDIGSSAISNYQYSLDNGSTWVTRSPASIASPLTISGLSTSTTYQVKLRAVNNQGSGCAAGPVTASTVMTAVVPSAPTDLMVTPGNGQLEIAFTPGTDGGSPITNYAYSLDGGLTWTALNPADNSSPVTIPGLTNGTTYSVELRAVNDVGAGAASAPVSGTPIAPATVPAAPTGLVATAGDGELTISFTPGNDGGSPITNYAYSTDGGLTWTALNPADNSSPVTIPGLTNGTSYTVQLRAVNDVGAGAASAPVTGTPAAPAVDCLGVSGGSALPGTACDDGYASTTNDTWSANCTCVGIPTGSLQDITLNITVDAFGSQTTWTLVLEGTNTVVAQGGPYPDGLPGSIFTEQRTVPAGCYQLVLNDAAGDGIQGGGYVLRTSGSTGERIIDNGNNFSTGSVSAISGGQGFCLPIGTVKLIYTSCDKLDWVNNQFIVAHPNAEVSTAWIDGAPNSAQSTTTGYQFWFFDPNGSYSFRRFRNHATSDGFGNVGATRACHMQINNWATSNHIPFYTLMNVRVRARIEGVNGEWGPACRFKIDPEAALCPVTKLMDIPWNSQLTCGQVRYWGEGNYAHARAVSGATQYQFRFRLPAEGYQVVRTTSSYFVQLFWTVPPPLMPGSQYEVDVRAYKNGQWCPWGDVCILNIGIPVQGQLQSMSILPPAVAVNLWPNPNNGEQLFLSLSELTENVLTVSVDLFDLTGKRVMARMIPAQGGSLNTVIALNGDLAAGLYMVNITAGDKLYTQRLVIQP